MAKINVYYRAFLNYRKETLRDKSCASDRKKFKKSGLEFDFLRAIKYKCTIDEEWIKEIEVGLEFVEKAVAEERQFIRVNGEVVPIEKVKKISKHSVEHLARHSNLITHVPDDPTKNIIPDAIYMVEKLNDYAVYENRFLYLLLCYLRDFIALRLNKIYRLRMTYICDFAIKKDWESKNRNFQYETTYHDERFDNPYPITDDSSNQLLKRIEDCQQIIIMLLNTDLMTEVAKSPMIKPPIVKTNVLKMDNNFVRSLALYDYIVAYSGDGYFSEEVVHEYSPFDENTADELAELVFLTRHLTYKYGNDLQGKLEQDYEIEEEIKRKEEEEKFLQQIKRMKKRVEETGMGLEEYILLLEKRNRMLEADAQELIVARNEIVKLNELIEQLNLEKLELNRIIDELKEEIEEKLREIAYLHQKYIEDMNALKEQHAREIEELNNNHALEIEELNNNHAQEIEELNNNHLLEVENLHNTYRETISNLNEEHETKISNLTLEYEDRIASINDQHNLEIADLNRLHVEEINSLELRLAEEHRIKSEQYLVQISDLNNQLSSLQERFNAQSMSYSNDVNDLNGKINNLENELADKIKEYEAKLKELETTYKLKVRELEDKNKQLSNDRKLAIAELDAIRILNGEKTPSEEFTSKERFKELEREFEAFNTFFKAQWAITKKEIRKQLLWKKEDQKKKIVSDAKKKQKEEAIKNKKENPSKKDEKQSKNKK